MDKKLFLIGNGFDIAHGFETSYLDLMRWMYKRDKTFLKDFSGLLLQNFLIRNGYYDEGEWWYNRPINNVDLRIDNMDIPWIEATMEYRFLEEHFDEPLIAYALWESLEENMHYVFLDKELADAEIERDSLRGVLEDEEYGPVTEADIDDIYRPSQERFDKLSKLADTFKFYLLQWIEDVNSTVSLIDFYDNEDDDDEIEYDDNDKNEILNMLPDDFFCANDYIINFNYSETIELLYSREVCHIHGEDNINNPPIMGHTKDFPEMYETDNKEMVLVKEFYKDFDLIFESNVNYLEKIQNVDEIVVLGLGYNDTDYPYFKKISSISPEAKWVLYYYSDEDYEKAQKYVEELSIKNENVKYISLKTETPYTKIARYN